MELTEIIRHSQLRLDKLKPLLSVFKHGVLVMISVRTKLIHEVFENNPDLELAKLELFHLQYTDALLQLLRKIKKNNEQKYQLLFSEISINNQYLENYNRDRLNDRFSEKSIQHNLCFQALLANIYQQLAFNQSLMAPNYQQIMDLAQDFGTEYFREIKAEDWELIKQKNSQNAYQSAGLSIDKKLLGRLNIQEFKFKFVCGFQASHQFIQIYKFIHLPEYFAFINQDLSLFPIDLADFNQLDFSKNQSNKQEIVAQLLSRNQQLTQQAEACLKEIPSDALQILNDYLSKISEIDLLQNLQNVDEQALVLKAMLNMKIE